MSAAHIIDFLNSMDEPEMAAEVLQMANRLEAFVERLDVAALDGAIRVAGEAIAQRDQLAGVLKRIMKEMDDDDGEAPGHCHEKKGHWDRDGSPCEGCAAWNDAKALLASLK